MPFVEDYKLFHNSLDFEKIYKESLVSLHKIYPDIEEFYCKYTDICVRNKTIKLLYNEKEIIGYVLFSIKDRILKFHFYYINPKNKNRKHGRFFRQQIFEQLKNKVDVLHTSINKTNFPALNAAKKSCKHLNLNFSLKEVNNPFYACNQFICEIQKMPLDFHKSQCDDETR